MLQRGQSQHSELNTNLPLTRIPLLSEEAQASLFKVSGQTVDFRIASLFDDSEEICQRHLIAQLITNALYHIGARIINEDAERFEKGQLSIEEASRLNTASELASSALIQQYNQLPHITVSSRGNTGKNPLHAVFILKVALDSLATEVIYKIYDKLARDVGTMNTDLALRFPNGSKFNSDHGLWQFVMSYICHHPERFHFMSETEFDVLRGNNDFFKCISILGTAQNAELHDQFEAIMNNKMLPPPLKQSENSMTDTKAIMSDFEKRTTAPLTFFSPPATQSPRTTSSDHTSDKAITSTVKEDPAKLFTPYKRPKPVDIPRANSGSCTIS